MSNKVELLGHYGGDLAHALSAWTSTSRELTLEKRARIPALLEQLATAGHETPFEKSALHFLVDSEVASHIHMIKHRIAVSLNGESARYKEIKHLRYYIPPDWPTHWQDMLTAHTRSGHKLYQMALKELEQAGLSRKRAKESARYFLGYNNVTTSDVMFNFRSFIHFLRLRYDNHAQDEIFYIAKNMLNLTRETGEFDSSLKAFGYDTK